MPEANHPNLPPIVFPRFVYRYLESEEHAKDMLQGRVWVSTFEHIRTVDTSRADSDEGNLRYSVGKLDDSVPPETAAVIADRMTAQGFPFRFKHGNGNDFSNNYFETNVPDAFMLCTSLKANDGFLAIIASGSLTRKRSGLRSPRRSIGKCEYLRQRFPRWTTGDATTAMISLIRASPILQA